MNRIRLPLKGLIFLGFLSICSLSFADDAKACKPLDPSILEEVDNNPLPPVRGEIGEKDNTLAPEVAKALAKIPTDPKPEQITRNLHYTTSNETRHYLFEEQIKDTGGIYIGVGAEQNYIFASWSRPEILILMDFDQYIVDLHMAYAVIFKNASTPEEFISLWSAKKKKSTKKLILKSIPKKRKARRVANIYHYTRKRISKHLIKLKKLYSERKSKIFLTDQGEYSFLKGMVEQGRVRSIRGDLTAKLTMKGIAKFSEQHNIPVRTLYLSNAEFYFPFSQGRYRRNIMEIPFDESSVVLHTFPYAGYSYRYIYHSGANFQAWLKSRKKKSIRQLLHISEKQEDEDLRYLRRSPDDPK